MGARDGRASRFGVRTRSSDRREATPAGAASDFANSAVLPTGTIAWLLFCGVNVQYAVGMLVWAMNQRRGPVADLVGDLAIFVPFGTLGVVVARRRPAQTLGWLFLAIGFGGAAKFLLQESARLAVDQSGASVMVAAAAWVSSIVDWTVLGALVAVLVLLPTGRPHARWSRAVLWVIAASVVCGWSDRTFPPGDRQVIPDVGNPFGFGPMPASVAAVVEAGVFLFPPALVGAVAALADRFARARGRERQQLKIFVYAVVVGGTVFLLPEAARTPLLGGSFDTPAGSAVRWAFPPAAVAVGIGVAILRHGLYDIDRIISRTVVYAGVTAVLGLGYSAVVLVSGQLLGADEQVPAWMVASATLAVAAVFRPVRRAMQTYIERKFNRTRYDMRKTIDEFNQRLRDEVAFATLHEELVDVIQQTLQPTMTVLWLAASAPPPAEGRHAPGVATAGGGQRVNAAPERATSRLPKDR